MTVRKAGGIILFVALGLSICLAFFVLRRPAPDLPDTSKIKGGAGELRVLLSQEPPSLNPDLVNNETGEIIGQNLFSRLVSLDASFRLVPDLASSWEVSRDGLAYTFHLREGVRWHDGAPLTSADVKGTLETLAKAGGAGRDAGEHIDRMDIHDDQTLTIHLKAPWSPFLRVLAYQTTFILPRHIYEGTDWQANPANQKPVGSGPFRFVGWIKGDKIVLAANNKYFDRGPLLDRVIFRFARSPEQAAAAIEHDEVDFLRARPPVDSLARLQTAPGVIVRTFPSTIRIAIGFNLARAPYGDLRVRQALNMAINRAELVAHAMRGYGIPSQGFYTAAVPWAFNSSVRVPDFDPVHANRLLDDAGILRRGAEGIRLQAELLVPISGALQEIANLVHSQLAAVGIRTKIVTLPSLDWADRVNRARNFDMAMMLETVTPDPVGLEFRYATGAAINFMGYSNPELDAAFAAGARGSAWRPGPPTINRCRQFWPAICLQRRWRIMFSLPSIGLASPGCLRLRRAGW